MKRKITKLEENKFVVEYLDPEDAKEIRQLKTFTYEGKEYSIKKVHDDLERSPFYLSYFVITE